MLIFEIKFTDGTSAFFSRDTLEAVFEIEETDTLEPIFNLEELPYINEVEEFWVNTDKEQSKLMIEAVAARTKRRAVDK